MRVVHRLKSCQAVETIRKVSPIVSEYPRNRSSYMKANGRNNNVWWSAQGLRREFDCRSWLDFTDLQDAHGS